MVHENEPTDGVNTFNWWLDQIPFTASHEYGHLALGLRDAYLNADPSAVPPPEPDGIDPESLMGAYVPALRPWYFDNILGYFDGLAIDMILAGAPPDGIPGGEVPDESPNEMTGTSGLTYIPIPEPASFALLALALGVLMRRRKRAA